MSWLRGGLSRHALSWRSLSLIGLKPRTLAPGPWPPQTSLAPRHWALALGVSKRDNSIFLLALNCDTRVQGLYLALSLNPKPENLNPKP